MPTNLFIDTETCGLHGFPVLIQYAYDDGPVILHEVWREPVWRTLELIEEFTKYNWVMFNAAFDTFHLIKTYTTFSLLVDKDEEPINQINEIVEAEEKARTIDICVKPKSCSDLMLLARKGKYQSLMAREPIKIKRIPTSMSFALRAELEKQVKLDDIYFAKAKDKYGPRWKIMDVKTADGTFNPDFKDIVLKFRASGALKTLARHAFNLPEPILFRDIEVDKQFWPLEFGYAPYANAVYRAINQNSSLVAKCDRDRKPWPDVIIRHIVHWQLNEDARTYAKNDIDLTRRLYYEHFDSPEGGTDSQLACMVAACRWRGYSINVPKIKELRALALNRIKTTPTSPKQAKAYVTQVMDEIDKIGIQNSTKKQILEDIVREWKELDSNGNEIPHPAAIRAQEVLNARQAIKEVELYDKLILAGRFHASFIVTGTLSNRMAGSDGLNPQGIKNDDTIREAFTLTDDPDFILSGGDFESFEVSLAAAVFKDSDLDETLKSGVKVHSIMAQELYPHRTMEEIKASKGHPTLFPEKDMYDTGKKAFFSKIYAGNEFTWEKKLGIPLEIGGPANRRLELKYPGIKRAQDAVDADFGALKQPGGLGSKVEWHEPKGYVESFLGFKRFFTLEMQIAKTLFKLAENPPKEWSKFKMKVSRRVDRIQTVGGACRSALYGAAFGIISGVIRAAINHLVQSPGGEITKAAQAAIWELQPSGIQQWFVQPMNIHDEIQCPTRKGYEGKVKTKVLNVVESYRDRVPLLAIGWFESITSWAGKKG